MKGELYQMCRLTAAAKSALLGNSEFGYEPIPYENKIEFLFLPNISDCGITDRTAADPETWYEYLTKKGLRDIKLLTATDNSDIRMLGFANSLRGGIVCWFKNGEVTAFYPAWSFDKENKVWNILYTEELKLVPFEQKPCFDDNTDDFREVLIEISDLAERIDCGAFASIFDLTRDILDGKKQLDTKLPLPQIPEKYLPMFCAADRADVFGAMGSWNDSPPYMAQEKGLDKEYDELSARLLKNIRLAVLYAINEWQ